MIASGRYSKVLTRSAVSLSLGLLSLASSLGSLLHSKILASSSFIRGISTIRSFLFVSFQPAIRFREVTSIDPLEV